MSSGLPSVGVTALRSYISISFGRNIGDERGCRHHARRDRVAADALLAVERRHVTCERVDTGLRHAVRDTREVAELPGARRRVHDRAATRFEHVGDRVLGAQQRAAQVDGKRSIPHLDVHGRDVEIAQDDHDVGRVRVQEMERTEGVDGRPAQLGDRFLLGDVDPLRYALRHPPR